MAPTDLPDVEDSHALDMLLLENYSLIAATHEQQNAGRHADALTYQRRLSANLQAFVDALRASPAGIELAPDDSDGADAAAAARDAAALLAANAGGSAAARPPPAQPDSSQQHAREQLLRQQQQPPPAPLQIEEPQPKQQAPAWAAGINQSVAGLLHALGLSEFQPLFEEARVDMAALQLLGREDLRELGLPLGAIVKLLAALKEGRQQQQQDQ